MSKRCPGCERTKDERKFNKNKIKLDGLNTYCRQCTKAKWKIYNNDAARKSKRQWKRRLKEQFIEEYGGRCSCCKENRIEFLNMAHIGGGGNEHRRQIGKTKPASSMTMISSLKSLGWPKEINLENGKTVRIGIHCWNCNCAIGMFGYCPHDEPERWKNDT